MFVSHGPHPRRGVLAIAALCVPLLLSIPFVAPASADDTPVTEPTVTAPPAPEPVPAPPAPAPPPAPEIDWPALIAFFRAIYPPVPEWSGYGRRIVYSVRAQRVWLVGANERVEKTYPVSGRTGMPRPGSYRIYSASRWASSGSVRMQYMLRFARGSRLAIGFHSIPVRSNGSMLQTLGELGSPRSHGCVRQSLQDAAELWWWAPVGTAVVVMP